MRHPRGLLLGICGWVCLSASLARGDPKVDATDISVNGNAVGFYAGPLVKHYLVLVAKGSHFVMYTDGQAGPRFESMYWTNGGTFNAGGNLVGMIPALFTPDGEHYAYCYKDGTHMVIVLDGKELARATGLLTMPLTFSRNGKYLAWSQGNSIYINGKPGPPARYQPQLMFSPDGSHYAYTGTVVGGNAPWAVVDGRQVKYFGEINQYSASNHIFAVYHDDPSNTSILVMDGKPVLRTFAVRNLWTSADAKEIAIQVQPDATSSKTVVNVNGKAVPDADSVFVGAVYFSPDGKRYALNCNAPGGGNFMIIDGKKQDTYQSIPTAVATDSMTNFQWANPAADAQSAPKTPAFTSDSSKFVYLATSNGRNFLMTEDGEYDDYTITYQKLTVAPAGGHYGFVGTNHSKKEALIIDGKAVFTNQLPNQTAQRAFQDFIFSPDGAHYAFIGEDGFLYEDGNKLPGGVSGQNFVFSPNGNHLAYVSYRYGVAVDGKIVVNPGPGHSVSFPLWSADDQHFYFIAYGNVPNSKDMQQLYCDGKVVAHFDGVSIAPGHEYSYDLSPQGVLTFVALTDGTLTKYVVTPDSNIEAAIATGKPPPDSL